MNKKGKTGYFVVTENSPHLENVSRSLPEHYQQLLEPYFEKVNFVGLEPLFYSYGKMTKGAFIFKCAGYNGKLPPDEGLY